MPLPESLKVLSCILSATPPCIFSGNPPSVSFQVPSLLYPFRYPPSETFEVPQLLDPFGILLLYSLVYTSFLLYIISSIPSYPRTPLIRNPVDDDKPGNVFPAPRHLWENWNFSPSTHAVQMTMSFCSTFYKQSS